MSDRGLLAGGDKLDLLSGTWDTSTWVSQQVEDLLKEVHESLVWLSADSLWKITALLHSQSEPSTPSFIKTTFSLTHRRTGRRGGEDWGLCVYVCSDKSPLWSRALILLSSRGTTHTPSLTPPLTPSFHSIPFLTPSATDSFTLSLSHYFTPSHPISHSLPLSLSFTPSAHHSHSSLYSLHPSLSLTSQCLDQGLAILQQLLDELAGLVQLLLVGAQPLPEVRTVQVAFAELQGREAHL